MGEPSWSAHPKLGQRYEDTTDAMVANRVILVPVGYDDTGNLLVDHYDGDPGSPSSSETESPHYDGDHDDDPKTVPWSEDGFADKVENGEIIELGGGKQ